SYLKSVTNKDGKTALSVLFDEIAPKYADRSGGYTKVTKTYFRKGDNAPMATIELN
ncbi:MAG: 50S ribosomal protein L17, partial [Erysipelotrichales bacterium]|nr:50S ribosomal protein L17 [Erysipelotrichales bacterium]